MSVSADPRVDTAPRPDASERLVLARLARNYALLVPGVAGTDSGPTGLFVTAGAGERVDGVICTATQDSGYDVSLQLVCGLVPLLALGEQVKQEVRQAATRQGIPVASVSVRFSRLQSPDDDAQGEPR